MHLNNPSGIAVDPSGNIIIADSGNHRLAVFRPDGDIYYIHHYYPHGNTETTVSRISPDGTIKKYQYIENKVTSGAGIKVDSRGNIYLGLALKPSRRRTLPQPA